jgi:hypothetical protein
MGNYEVKSRLCDNEVYLSEVQYMGQTDLMFQSKLSTYSNETKLIKKLYPFNSSS